MASKRNKTKPAAAEAAGTAHEEPTAAPAAAAPEVATLEAVHETITREEARLRIACALLQCPRFAARIQQPADQDYLVKVTDELTAKLGY